MDDTRQRILDHLHERTLSGPELATACDISRVAVWKHIDALREMGFTIMSTDDGYRLDAIPDYGKHTIALGLDAPYAVRFHDTVESTNDVARSIAAAGEPAEAVIIADRQIAGRGRLGRSWEGPPGGIYLSILLRPSFSPRDVPILTVGAAVAVSEAIEQSRVAPSIKWPNDLLYGSEKVGGILTEMTGEADRVQWVVVGIGVNANTPVDALPDQATSLQSVTGEQIDRRAMVQEIIERFHAYRLSPQEILPAWRNRTATIGNDVRVTTGEQTVIGQAVDIAYPGSLVIDTDDGAVTVHAGDCEHLRAQD